MARIEAIISKLFEISKTIDSEGQEGQATDSPKDVSGEKE
jgi:hypothetical protein